MTKRSCFLAPLALCILALWISGVGCFGPSAAQKSAGQAPEASTTPQEWMLAAVATPTATPTPTQPPPAVQFIRKSDKVFVVTVSPETRTIIDADSALETARNRVPGSASEALRTGAYLIKVGDLRKRMDVPRLPDDHPLWVVSYQGLNQAQYILEVQVRIDALAGQVLDTGSTRGTGLAALKAGMAFFDPPGLPPLVLPSPVPPGRLDGSTPAPRVPTPFPVALTEDEKKLTVDIILREPAVQRATAQNTYDVRMIYGFQDPGGRRVGRAHIYLKDTAISYDLAVDLTNRRIIDTIVKPLISAPGPRTRLTDEEERLARDVAYGSAVVKEKVAGKTLQGDYVVGYLNDRKEKMAVVLIYVGPDLTYQPIVDLVGKRVISSQLKEIVAFAKPSPLPSGTPTPPRPRPLTPTPPPPVLPTPPLPPVAK